MLWPPTKHPSSMTLAQRPTSRVPTHWSRNEGGGTIQSFIKSSQRLLTSAQVHTASFSARFAGSGREPFWYSPIIRVTETTQVLRLRLIRFLPLFNRMRVRLPPLCPPLPTSCAANQYSVSLMCTCVSAPIIPCRTMSWGKIYQSGVFSRGRSFILR